MSKTLQPDWSDVFKQAFNRKQAKRLRERMTRERRQEEREFAERYRDRIPPNDNTESYKP